MMNAVEEVALVPSSSSSPSVSVLVFGVRVAAFGAGLVPENFLEGEQGEETVEVEREEEDGGEEVVVVVEVVAVEWEERHGWPLLVLLAGILNFSAERHLRWAAAWVQLCPGGGIVHDSDEKTATAESTPAAPSTNGKVSLYRAK